MRVASFSSSKGITVTTGPRISSYTEFPVRGCGQKRRMTETVQVEAARIPDRDRLLEELREAGLDARPVDEVGIEVPLEADADPAPGEVIAPAEWWIRRPGAPFVPIKHDGVNYTRPPLS